MNDPRYSYPYPPQGYYGGQGPPPPVNPPPLQYPPQQPREEPGCLEGCLLALCCCGLLEVCLDPSQSPMGEPAAPVIIMPVTMHR